MVDLIAQDFYQLTDSSRKPASLFQWSPCPRTTTRNKKEANLRPTNRNQRPASEPIAPASAFTRAWIKPPPWSWGRSISHTHQTTWTVRDGEEVPRERTGCCFQNKAGGIDPCLPLSSLCGSAPNTPNAAVLQACLPGFLCFSKNTPDTL